MNFEMMIKPRDRVHVYGGVHADLFLGSGIAVTYVQLGDDILVMATYFECATINFLDLYAITKGLNVLTKDSPFTVHTNNRYVKIVLENLGSWRNQGLIEEKAHPEKLLELVEIIDALGEGRLELSVHQNGRDDVMIHLVKYARHLYHRCQMEMITTRSSDISKDFFPFTTWKIQDLPGSILWKTPLSSTQFEKKMLQSKGSVRPALKLVQGPTS